jgi:chromosomal replication initiation ATPase DnaA
MRQLALDLGHRPALGRADFLVAPGNAVAVEWIDRWPDWPGHGLALHGPAGAGKTHLACVFRERSGARAVAPAALGRAEPPELLGDAAACVIDGLEEGSLADEAAARGLFHLFNMLAERRGALLLVGRLAPARWRVALPDLRSRLVTLPTAALGPPDDALLRALLVKLFDDRQLALPEAVLSYLLPRMERSFDAAQALVEALDRAALSGRRTLTVPLAREVLEGQIDDKSET